MIGDPNPEEYEDLKTSNKGWFIVSAFFHLSRSDAVQLLLTDARIMQLVQEIVKRRNDVDRLEEALEKVNLAHDITSAWVISRKALDR